MNLAEAFETFLPFGIDNKGRQTGYVVGLREDLDTKECYAWVQKSIKTPGGWKDFGPTQRSKKFRNLSAARTWAYATAKVRSQENRKSA